MLPPHHHLRFALYFLAFVCFAAASTVIYTLSLHDALPILRRPAPSVLTAQGGRARATRADLLMQSAASPESDVYPTADRKSTRLNSSHTVISYAVFCLKKKTTVYFMKPPHRPHHTGAPLPA